MRMRFDRISVSLLTAFACLFLLIAASGFAQNTSLRYALIIGNANYTRLPKLKNAINDASDMADILKEFGWNVTLLLNADLPQMEQAVVRLGNSVSIAPSAVGLFYYAGHGVQANGINYLIPTDADIASEVFLKMKSLAAQSVLDELQSARNNLNIIILDACRDNPFSWARSGSRGLSVISSQPPGSIIVFATGAGSVAQEGSGDNGVFTAELLKNLRTPGLDIGELLNRTCSAVQEATNGQQNPAIYSQFFKSFYFNEANASKTTNPLAQNSSKQDFSSYNLNISQIPLKTANVLVTSSEVNADIYLNGSYKGQAPLFIENVSAEREVYLEARKGEYEGEARITLEPSEHREVEIKMSFNTSRFGSIDCRVPDSARVMVLNKETGESTFFNGSSILPNLQEGWYYLEASSAGYEVKSETIKVVRGVQVVWEPFNKRSTLQSEDIQACFPPSGTKLAQWPTAFIVPEVANAERYELQISAQPDFKGNIIFDIDGFISNKMDASLAKLTKGNQYYWRYRVKKNNSWGEWSQPASIALGYRVIYDGNGYTSGSIPYDINGYLQGDTAIVQERPIGFEKWSYGFSGWNTKADGRGTNYSSGSVIPIKNQDITLYAKWRPLIMSLIMVIPPAKPGDSNEIIQVPIDWNVKDVASVAEGAFHTMIIRKDGSLWAFGNNSFGQLGDGTTKTRTNFVRIMKDVRAVSAGERHTMILKNDGSLWAVGDNGSGQLGDGSYTSHLKPVKVMDNVASVKAGTHHTMIIKQDDSLWAAGSNTFGQLGDGTNASKPSFVKIMENVKTVAVGNCHTLIVKNDGTLWATGSNSDGQLCDGTHKDTNMPIHTMDNVELVAAGESHSMILKKDFGLWAAGSNLAGQLGIQGNSEQSVPVLVMENVRAVAAMYKQTMIIKTDNTLWLTGMSSDGPSIPTKIMDNVESAAVGYYQAVILK
jgi:alpha-tubulin suppressor-like RCC1 family protein